VNGYSEGDGMASRIQMDDHFVESKLKIAELESKLKIAELESKLKIAELESKNSELNEKMDKKMLELKEQMESNLGKNSELKKKVGQFEMNCNKPHQIPKSTKKHLWDKYFTSVFTPMCPLNCGTHLNPFDFVAGHIISRKNGGSDSVDNLLPICALCNGSMSFHNLDDYVHQNKIQMLYGIIIVHDDSEQYTHCEKEVAPSAIALPESSPNRDSSSLMSIVKIFNKMVHS